MTKPFRSLALPVAFFVLAIGSAGAEPKTLASPRQYPAWFLPAKDLGALSWEDSYGNGEGGLFLNGSYAYVFHTSLTGKELISRVEAWAHGQHYEVVDRTGDVKLVASEFDLEKDPVGAGKRAMAKGHTRLVNIEVAGEHEMSMTLRDGTLQ